MQNRGGDGQAAREPIRETKQSYQEGRRISSNNCFSLPSKELFPARRYNEEEIVRLRDTVGVEDPEEEFHQARDRYQNALKPLTQPPKWDSWLDEYEQAVTEAEREKVGEVLSLKSMYGISSKQLPRLIQPGAKRLAFLATEEESTFSATSSNEDPPRATIQKNRARSRQPITKCSACGLGHNVENCYYVHKSKAPEWFKPRAKVGATIQKRLREDKELKEQVQISKRARTGTSARR
ncbi:hypothetical protein DM02DRAFT_689845 [Periconia macrospinosa]|uniref:Uncharacterized protein n=1 Tax=Periconia macrospinosa TaxID=97972 RepID=A0A2V1E2X2_9PLEO|nr:hypothetical protein DM02DRAFT_689845 [Periconia macrospinosa]